jgi:hypothetical protein
VRSGPLVEIRFDSGWVPRQPGRVGSNLTRPRCHQQRPMQDHTEYGFGSFGPAGGLNP